MFSDTLNTNTPLESRHDRSGCADSELKLRADCGDGDDTEDEVVEMILAMEQDYDLWTSEPQLVHGG